MEQETPSPAVDSQPQKRTLEELEAALAAQSKPPEPNQEIDSPQAESDAAKTSEGESDSPAELPEKLTPKALAEKLGISPKKLYDLLEIDLGDGNTVTLGQYKDQAKEFHKVDAARKELASNRVKIENDLMQKRMALDKVAAQRGYNLTQADLQQIEQQHSLHRQAQTALLAEIVPEFADTVARDKGLQMIEGVFQEYAFGETEAKYITDARLRKMAYDLARLRAEIDGFETKEVKKSVNQSPKSHTPVRKAGPNGSQNRQQVDAAVSKLAQFLR
jgi:AraC-like DNA-binding protein